MSTLPSTYGGAGWSRRAAPHAQDLQRGVLWHPCGQSSEVSELKEVLLCWPPDTLGGQGDPDAHLLLQWPDLALLREQALGVGDFYASQGVQVRWLREAQAPPNTLFMADLLWSTPEGVVLARPASPVRAPEARLAAVSLAALGVPLVMSVHGDAVFEGADACWLSQDTVLLGLGRRTDAAAAAQLRALLVPMGVEVITTPLPPGVQHLMGILRLLDHDLAMVDAERCSPSLRRLLRDRGVALVELPATPALRQRMGMNGVVLRAREVALPDGCPGIRAQLEGHGVWVHTLPLSEYVKCAGGLGCATGVLRRA